MTEKSEEMKLGRLVIKGDTLGTIDDTIKLLSFINDLYNLYLSHKYKDCDYKIKIQCVFYNSPGGIEFKGIFNIFSDIADAIEKILTLPYRIKEKKEELKQKQISTKKMELEILMPLLSFLNEEQRKAVIDAYMKNWLDIMVIKGITSVQCLEDN
jgi:hypothetical protein